MWFAPHCGFQLNHSISLFTSPNLSQNGSWAFIRDILPVGGGRPEAVYFRPQVIFNPRTGLWVLWVNAVPLKDGIADYSASTYVVAVAPMLDAQFTVVRNATQTRYGGGLGDLSLFVDQADEAGYVAYAAWDAAVHSVSIERLTPDFLESAAVGPNASALSSGPIGPSMQEAPLLFERGGHYYLTAGHVCCFCPEGADSRVWSAPAPLGPWTEQGYIDPPANKSGGGLLRAQNSLLVVVPDSSGGEPTLVWAADRWLSAPDLVKAHDFQYWAPLVWNASTTPRTPQQLSWAEGFSLEVPTGAAQ
jgi:hypothetical protein